MYPTPGYGLYWCTITWYVISMTFPVLVIILLKLGDLIQYIQIFQNYGDPGSSMEKKSSRGGKNVN